MSKIEFPPLEWRHESWKLLNVLPLDLRELNHSAHHGKYERGRCVGATFQEDPAKEIYLAFRQLCFLVLVQHAIHYG